MKCHDELNVEMLRSLVYDRLRQLDEGTYIPHDLRVFIKDEPHKISKMQAGRYRLIMVMSLEDQMVDRMLMHTWAKRERFWWRCPGKTGWSPLPVGFRYFNSVFDGQVLATDCSAFDWTLPEWVPPLLLRMRLELMEERSPMYERQLINRWEAVLKHAIVRLPDGRRFRQNRWGLMKSGWLRTIAENSSAQVFINALGWKRSGNPGPMPTIWTMGDDVILRWRDEYNIDSFERSLATTGIIVKQSSRAREFAGFRIEPGKVTPLYPDKHRFMLHFTEPEKVEEVAMAYALLYALADQPSWLNNVTRHSLVATSAARLWAIGAVSF